MGNGDEAQEGGQPSRVRVLPSDGMLPLDTESSEATGRAGRPPWAVPLVAGLVALGILLTTVGGLSSPAVSTTQAPSMSGFEDEYIDLRPGDNTQTRDWNQVGIAENAVSATDLIVSNNFVVTGDTAESPTVWISTTGSTWREPSQFPLLGGNEVNIDQAVPWQEEVIALGAVADGIGVWRSSNLYAWEYEERIVGEISIDALVAGPQLLLIGTAGDGTRAAWTSDGSTWVRLGEIVGLDDVSVNVFTADDSWYYAGGAESCPSGGCRPVVYRSADGRTWEATTGTEPGVLATGTGTVRDIAGNAEGLFAVGTGADGEAAVWYSTDESPWTRIALDTPELPASGTTIKLIATRPGENATADISIGDDHYTVGVGSRIATLAGEITVAGITETGIDVDDGGSATTLGLDSSITISRSTVVDHISVHGRRILLAGTIRTSDREVPAAWTSTDNGQRWQLSVLAPTGGTTIAAGISKRFLVVVGTTPEAGLVIWHSSWDTSEAEAGGLAALKAFVRLLNERDVDGLIGALPEQRDAGSGSFQIPSLGAADLGWWNGNGDLDPTAVADTVAYLDAMATNIRIEDCDTRSELADPDTIFVNCAFSASSDLLTFAGFGDDTGRIEGTFPAGSLNALALRLDPYTQVWASMQRAAEAATPADRATLLATDELGRSVLRPLFNGETAAIHLEIARRYAEGQLRPGGTTTVATALGTMEWQWMDLPMSVLYVETIAYLEAADEFVLIGHGGNGPPTDLSVWTSHNGLEWEQRPGPAGYDSIWDLRPIGGELVGQAWNEDSVGLVFFDGADWSEVAIASADPGTYPSFESLSVGGDTVLVIMRYWSETADTTPEPQAWLVGPDRTPRSVPPPPLPEPADYPMSVSGADDGFIFTVADPETGVATVWYSEDGRAWSVLGEAAQLGSAPFLWSLQSHRGRHFRVAEGGVCDEGGDGDGCRYELSLWSSPDGITWDLATTDSGEPLEAYEIGSGPLGLVAVGQPVNDEAEPRPLYLSANGVTWEEPANFSFFDPTADWWWTSRPAVGSDTIVIPGSSYQETSGAENVFLLVGRVVAS